MCFSQSTLRHVLTGVAAEAESYFTSPFFSHALPNDYVGIIKLQLISCKQTAGRESNIISARPE